MLLRTDVVFTVLLLPETVTNGVTEGRAPDDVAFE
jgi:hypothetical protein